MGWVVGFEPTYTGATTLGLNHLTIPTMLVNCVHYCVTASLALSCVHKYAPFDSRSACLVLRTISCAYKFVNCVRYCVVVSFVLGYVHKYVPFGTHSTRLVLHKITCAYLKFKLCVTASLALSCVHKYAPFDSRSACLVLRTISCAYKFVNFVHCVVAVSLVMRVQFLKELATWNGLEPSTSSVTGWHSNQLNYQAANGGSYRARTCDPLLVRQMLSQLS